MSLLIHDLVLECKRHGGSDVHVRVGSRPFMRINGEIVPMPEELVVDKKEFSGFLEEHDIQMPPDICNVDASVVIDGITCRLDIFRAKDGQSIAIRLLNDKVPSLKELKLPKQVDGFLGLKTGLVVISGTVGSGKTTTLAAIIDWYNSNNPGVILTIEDPVEFTHNDKKSLVHQRQVGKDVESFELAVKQALRQDANIILVGETRDKETIENVITLAETGHLVLTTVHAKSAPEVVERLAGVFPTESRQAIITRLTEMLQGVMHMRLVRTRNKRRVAFCHVMMMDSRIRVNLAKKDYSQVRDMMRTTPTCLSDFESARDLIENQNVDPEVLFPLMDAEDVKTVCDQLKIERAVL